MHGYLQSLDLLVQVHGASSSSGYWLWLLLLYLSQLLFQHSDGGDSSLAVAQVKEQLWRTTHKETTASSLHACMTRLT